MLPYLLPDMLAPAGAPAPVAAGTLAQVWGFLQAAKAENTWALAGFHRLVPDAGQGSAPRHSRPCAPSWWATAAGGNPAEFAGHSLRAGLATAAAPNAPSCSRRPPLPPPPFRRYIPKAPSSRTAL